MPHLLQFCMAALLHPVDACALACRLHAVATQQGQLQAGCAVAWHGTRAACIIRHTPQLLHATTACTACSCMGWWHASAWQLCCIASGLARPGSLNVCCCAAWQQAFCGLVRLPKLQAGTGCRMTCSDSSLSTACMTLSTTKLFVNSVHEYIQLHAGSLFLFQSCPLSWLTCLHA